MAGSRRSAYQNRVNIYADLQCDVFLTGITFVVFINALTCDLVFDDVSAIVKNADVRPDEVSVWSLFVHDYWGSPISSDISHKSYRPLTVLTFRWNYAVHQLDPAGYHVVNVILHALNVICVRRLAAQLIFSDTSSSSSYAMITSLLFAVHPVHTEAVVGVVGRAEELAALFALTALLFYSAKRLIPFTVCVVASLLSKEQGVTILAVAFCYEITHVLVEECAASRKAAVKQSVTRLVFLIVLAIVTIAFRLWIMGGVNNFPVFTLFDNPASFAPFPVRHLTYNFLLALNGLLLLMPIHLCCDWTMKSIPLVRSLSDPRNAATLFFYAILLLLVWRSLVEVRRSFDPRSVKSRARLPLILSLIIFPFIPSTNLIAPVGFVVAERTLYLPSAGFCLLVAYGIRNICDHKVLVSRAVSPLMLITVFAFTLKTVTRSVDWTNELSLFQSGIRVNPNNAKLYNNIGHHYEKEQNWSQAIHFFRQAVDLQPDDLGSTINIARTHLNTGNFEEAESILWSVRPKILLAAKDQQRIPPNYLGLWINLGNIISKNESRLPEAESVYRELLSMRSDHVDALINLGDVLIRQHKLTEAVRIYERGVSLHQKLGELYYNLAVAHTLLLQEQIGKEEVARDSVALSVQVKKIVELFFQSLEVMRANRDALLNLAIMIQKYPALLRYRKMDVMQRMREYKGPEIERIWFNLALMFSDEGDNRTAEHYLQKAIQVYSSTHKLSCLINNQ